MVGKTKTFKNPASHNTEAYIIKPPQNYHRLFVCSSKHTAASHHIQHKTDGHDNSSIEQQKIHTRTKAPKTNVLRKMRVQSNLLMQKGAKNNGGKE